MTREKHYDVVVMGGGPAGSTVAASLRKYSKLSVALFEQDHFPREHIGESFAHRVIPSLEESGALASVLESKCWVKKYGGYYAWGGDPAALYFEHHATQRDGVHRWAIHVNRSEFDHILLQVAERAGTHVEMGICVTGVKNRGELNEISLSDGTMVTCKVFVEAGGRRSRSPVGEAREPRQFQSRYKNIAIWTHFLDCKLASSVDAPWNIFREGEKSPIANFAFEDGWVWYIPVPKVIDGQRRLTHSIGLVTDGTVATDPSRNYLDRDTFVRKLKTIPLLKDLIADATPVAEKLLTATNYSMVTEQFCDYDERWIRIGDAAYFVDPLFSSGVGFSLQHALSASLLIRHRLQKLGTDADSRDLWSDYDAGWHQVSGSYSLAIDQWYHALAKRNPTSTYWRDRASSSGYVDLHSAIFKGLVDQGTSLFNSLAGPSKPDTVRSDYFFILTQGSDRVADVGKDGPLLDFVGSFEVEKFAREDRLHLAEGVEVRDSAGLILGSLKAVSGPDDEIPPEFALYWQDPVKNASVVPPSFERPVPCRRFAVGSEGGQVSVKEFPDKMAKVDLADALKRGLPFGEYGHALTEAQRTTLQKLNKLGLLRVERAAGRALSA